MVGVLSFFGLSRCTTSGVCCVAFSTTQTMSLDWAMARSGREDLSIAAPATANRCGGTFVKSRETENGERWMRLLQATPRVAKNAVGRISPRAAANPGDAQLQILFPHPYAPPSCGLCVGSFHCPNCSGGTFKNTPFFDGFANGPERRRELKYLTVPVHRLFAPLLARSREHELRFAQ